MIVVITAREMLHDRLGRLVKGRVVDVPDHQALEWLRRGYAQRYETKVMQERPYMAAGAMEPSSASPVAQVSQPQTLSESSTGAKKRGRPKKEA